MWEKELKEAIIAGEKAKEEILKIYLTKFDVEIKSDDSPVTQADKNANAIIKNYLASVFPNHSFLTEEEEDDKSRLQNDYVWIIDPVDGTKDFIAKDDEFTTNIALSYKHEIVVGVVLIPAKNEIYYATKNGGAFHRANGVDTPIHVNDKKQNLTVLCSVFHTQNSEVELIKKYENKISNILKVGSSIKACYIAEGKAELTYRLSAGTKEWDVAACQIIVEEAGGIMIEPNGKRLTYNRDDVYNRNGYIIVNCKENILL